MTALRGKWAQGLQPRNYTWIIKDRMAAAERPGGLTRNHRKVRRTEELIWLRSNGFTRIISLLDSPHNLQAYTDAGLRCEHMPFGRHDELALRLRHHYTRVAGWLDDPNEKLFVHHDEFGDRLLGFLGGYLLFAGLVQEGPHAIAIVEKLGNRTLDEFGREVITLILDQGLRRA